MSAPKPRQNDGVQWEVAAIVNHVPRTGAQIARIASQRLGRSVGRATVASALTRLEGFGCVVRVGDGTWVEPQDALSEVRT
jgi:hypothetical protein